MKIMGDRWKEERNMTKTGGFLSAYKCTDVHVIYSEFIDTFKTQFPFSYSPLLELYNVSSLCIECNLECVKQKAIKIKENQP